MPPCFPTPLQNVHRRSHGVPCTFLALRALAMSRAPHATRAHPVYILRLLSVPCSPARSVSAMLCENHVCISSWRGLRLRCWARLSWRPRRSTHMPPLHLAWDGPAPHGQGPEPAVVGEPLQVPKPSPALRPVSWCLSRPWRCAVCRCVFGTARGCEGVADCGAWRWVVARRLDAAGKGRWWYDASPA